jgi:hypothetical protein
MQVPAPRVFYAAAITLWVLAAGLIVFVPHLVRVNHALMLVALGFGVLVVGLVTGHRGSSPRSS